MFASNHRYSSNRAKLGELKIPVLKWAREAKLKKGSQPPKLFVLHNAALNNGKLSNGDVLKQCVGGTAGQRERLRRANALRLNHSVIHKNTYSQFTKRDIIGETVSWFTHNLFQIPGSVIDYWPLPALWHFDSILLKPATVGPLLGSTRLPDPVVLLEQLSATSNWIWPWLWQLIQYKNGATRESIEIRGHRQWSM